MTFNDLASPDIVGKLREYAVVNYSTEPDDVVQEFFVRVGQHISRGGDIESFFIDGKLNKNLAFIIIRNICRRAHVVAQSRYAEPIQTEDSDISLTRLTALLHEDYNDIDLHSLNLFTDKEMGLIKIRLSGIPFREGLRMNRQGSVAFARTKEQVQKKLIKYYFDNDREI